MEHSSFLPLHCTLPRRGEGAQREKRSLTAAHLEFLLKLPVHLFFLLACLECHGLHLLGDLGFSAVIESHGKVQLTPCSTPSHPLLPAGCSPLQSPVPALGLWELSGPDITACSLCSSPQTFLLQAQQRPLKQQLCQSSREPWPFWDP